MKNSIIITSTHIAQLSKNQQERVLIALQTLVENGITPSRYAYLYKDIEEQQQAEQLTMSEKTFSYDLYREVELEDED